MLDLLALLSSPACLGPASAFFGVVGASVLARFL